MKILELLKPTTLARLSMKFSKKEATNEFIASIDETTSPTDTLKGLEPTQQTTAKTPVTSTPAAVPPKRHKTQKTKVEALSVEGVKALVVTLMEKNLALEKGLNYLAANVRTSR